MSLPLQAIPYEFEGEADLTFAEKGFRAGFRLPAINFVIQSDAAEAKPVVVSEVFAIKKPLKHAGALIAEDSNLLAAEHSSILSDLGF